MTGSGVVRSALPPLERAPHAQPDRSEVASVRPAFASSPPAGLPARLLLQAPALRKGAASVRLCWLILVPAGS